jgi:hypothetical protein
MRCRSCRQRQQEPVTTFVQELLFSMVKLEAALKARLEEAAASLLKQSTVAAYRAVKVYIAAVTRMPSSQLSTVAKSELIADADRIKVVVGCR